jgi:hypothetical protein
MIKYDGKMWVRICSDCGIELKYKYKRSADFQEEKNSVCKICCRREKFVGIYKNSNNLWCRKCPKCDSELPYKSRQICIIRYHKKSLCKTCSQIGDKAFWYGKSMSKETKEKMSNVRIGKKLSSTTKQKCSEQKLGKNNPMFGKTPTEEHREKMRIAALNRIQKQGIMVAFNPTACKFIEEFGKKNGYNFQHALNGGEVCLSGFPVDGYDKEKNVVFEYDEPHHYNTKRKEKDKYKEKCIIKKIQPKMFIRFDEKNNRLYDALTNLDI